MIQDSKKEFKVKTHCRNWYYTTLVKNKNHVPDVLVFSLEVEAFFIFADGPGKWDWKDIVHVFWLNKVLPFTFKQTAVIDDHRWEQVDYQNMIPDSNKEFKVKIQLVLHDAS